VALNNHYQSSFRTNTPIRTFKPFYSPSQASSKSRSQLIGDGSLFCVTGPRIATEAYRAGLQALARSVSSDELRQIQATSSLRQLEQIALDAQKLSSKSPRAGKLQHLVKVLKHYEGVLNILPQGHVDYSCLVWGAIKWLLQVCINYYDLLERLSTMLEEIGQNLPRILLYQQLLPTSRMSKIISQLYAAIVEFLSQTIAFFRKGRIKKYLSAVWKPFDLGFKDTVERIQRLQTCVENDAHATALAELRLATQHTLSSVLEVKKQQTVILLLELRRIILAGYEEDIIYQHELMETYVCHNGSEWETWIAEVTRHVAWSDHSDLGLFYVQTESIQQSINCTLFARWSQRAGRSHQEPLLFLAWSRSMTKLSALSCIVYQLLEQQPEALLYRRDPDFYVKKFLRQSISFEYLWEVFVEMISALPNLRIFLAVPSSGSDASVFVMTIIDLYRAGISTPLSILIHHITDPKLSNMPKRVELDNEFDIEPEFDASEAFSKVNRLEMEIHGRTSENLHYYVWSELWATLRYDMMVMTFHLVLQTIEIEFGRLPEEPLVLPHDEPTWTCNKWLNTDQLRSNQAKLLKRRIIAFLQQLPFEIPDNLYHYLRQSFHLTHGSHPKEILSESPDLPNGQSQIAPGRKPSSPSAESTQNTRTRSATWREVEQILQRTISNVFCSRTRNKLRDILQSNRLGKKLNELQINTSESAASFDIQIESKSINILDLIGKSIFVSKNWDPLSLNSTLQSLQANLVNAMELGARRTKQSYLLSVPGL
jgi:hypothetical protein